MTHLRCLQHSTHWKRVPKSSPHSRGRHQELPLQAGEFGDVFLYRCVPRARDEHGMPREAVWEPWRVMRVWQPRARMWSRRETHGGLQGDGGRRHVCT